MPVPHGGISLGEHPTASLRWRDAGHGMGSQWPARVKKKETELVQDPLVPGDHSHHSTSTVELEVVLEKHQEARIIRSGVF